MLNRTKQPPIRELGTFKLPPYTIYRLDNNIPVILFSAGEQEVSKVDLVLKAGSWHQPAPMAASSVASLLTAGTSSHTSHQIASQTDFYGAHLVSSANRDTATVTAFSLNKYLDQMVALMEEVVKKATFPQEEIDNYLREQEHRLRVNEQRVDYLARTRFNSYLFGEQHPYGNFTKEEHFRNVEPETLRRFHANYYHAGNSYFLASGKLPAGLLPILNKHFGGGDWEGATVKQENHRIAGMAPGSYRIQKKDAVQSAIRMGKVLFTRSHPDFQAMKVVNTIFGGYFGSRLMKNIREDKGYTYGIHSSVQSMLHEGLFTIAAETGKEVTGKAIEEIFIELEKLQNDLVGAGELETVKSYLLGNVLKMVDGAFSAGDFFRTLYDAGLDEQYFYDFIDTIKNIKVTEIRDLAQKHLKKEDFIQIIAGS